MVKLTYFVTDIASMNAIRRVRDELIDVSTLPSSTAVVVAGLILPELLMEIEALAVIP